MLRLQEANQPAPQARLFPQLENRTAIPARMSRDKTGRVKVSSVVPTGPHQAEMLTAGALCRDQVKRVVETAASQRLAVTAIPDKPKVKASSLLRKVRKWKQQNLSLGGGPERYSSLSWPPFVCSMWNLQLALLKIGPLTFSPKNAE